MMRLSRLIVYSMVLLLSACSLFSKVDDSNRALMLLPPAEGPAPSVVKQVITLRARGDETSFLVVTKLELEKLGLVALLPTGQTLLTLDYDGLNLEQKVFTEINLPSEEMLAIMQFALWPELSVKQHYSRDAGWAVTIEPELRTLSSAIGKVLTIRYKEDTVLIQHHSYQYEVLVKTIEKKLL